MLRVNLFGGAAITLNGLEVPLTGRPLALLAYLTLVPKMHQRITLARLFHEDSENPQARFRWTLNKLKQHLGSNYLISDRQVVSFNFESNYELDVQKLINGKVEVYNGELLAGLHLNRALDFMNWLLFQREGYRSQAESILVKQLDSFLQSGSWQQVITTSHHLLQLDNLREEWLLPLMQAYEQVGNVEQALQLYGSYERTLSDELDIKPGSELRHFSSRLSAKTQASQSLRKQHTKTSAEPAFFQDLAAIQPEVDFFGRSGQLQHLFDLLEQIIEKQDGQVCFVKGSSGSGKSALIRAFVNQATSQYNDLLVTYSLGTSFDGNGSAYQPFVDILSILMADNLKTVASRHFLPLSQAQRLWQAAPKIGDIVHTYGSFLLQRWFPHQSESLDKEANHETQHVLFRQLASVLTTISTYFPLVICLDDFQWVDESSISLLFHLEQYLKGRRILIIGAYREDTVNFLANNGKTDLLQTINEIQRRTGTASLNLDSIDEDENKSFANTLLDKDSNQYSIQFRQAFFAQTNGHPLFAIELLNALKADGLLFQSKGGAWQNRTNISWDTMPTRIEAVIANRVNNLSEEIQQILSIAAVEGDCFSIQLVGQIAGYSNRSLMQLLAPLLTQRPPLIQQTSRHSDNAILQMQFSQKLFQQFFYQRISPAELVLLHGEIAEILENLYKQSPKRIEAKLAYHFEKARLFLPAVTYYQLAAETAVSQFANEDAISYFSKALELLPEREQVQRADFLLAREGLHDLLGNRQEQAVDLNALQVIANHVPNTHLPSVYLLRQAKLAFNRSKFRQAAHLVMEIIKQQKAPLEILLSAYQLFGQINLIQGNTDEAKIHFEKAMNSAKEITAIGTEATIFRSFSLVSAMQGELTIARSFLDKARSIHHHTNSPIGEAKVLQNICSLEHRKGNYQIALHHGQQALAIFQKTNYRQGEGQILQELGDLYLSLGVQREALIYQHQARQHFRNVGDRMGEAISLGYLGRVYHQQRNIQEAQNFAESAVAQMEMLNLNWHRCWALILLIKILIQQNNLEDAAKKIDEVALIWGALGISSIHLGIQAVKANLALLNANIESAAGHIQSIEKDLNSRMLDWTDDPFYIYTVCYEVLKEVDPAQAEQFLETAYQIVQRAALKLEGTTSQNYFLKNIPSQQKIIGYYNQSREV